MYKPLILSLSIIILSSGAAFAATTINDMQACQGYLDFVDNKLDDLKETYSAEDLNTIRTGLVNYNQYIQQTIITPGLLEFTGNDAQKASETQLQIDAYKTHISESLKQKYQDDKMVVDYAVVFNSCSTFPSGMAFLAQSLRTTA